MAPRSMLALVVVAGCGAETPAPPPELEPAAVEPVCGRASPVRLLALDPDQTLVDDRDAVRFVGGRLYFVVGRGWFYGPSIDDETTLYSVGPCGEEPRVIATNIAEVFEDEQWPGMLLGISGDDLVVLDPMGVEPPQLLMTDVHRMRSRTPYGLVETRYEDGADRAWLELRPFPERPGEPEPARVLLGEVQLYAGAVVSVGNEVLFPALGNEVHSIALPDVTPTVEITGAFGFEATADGRFVVWRGPPDEAGYQAVHVRDRLTRNEVIAGGTDQAIELHDDYLIVEPADLPELTPRLVSFPELDIIDVPTGVFPLLRVDASRWLAWHNPPSWLLFDAETASSTKLASGTGTSFAKPDRLETIVSDQLSWFDPSNQGFLEAAWFDGRGTTRLADRATAGYWRLADGRVATPLDVDDFMLGALALTDRDGVTRWQLDSDVVAWVAKHQAPEAVGDDAHSLYGQRPRSLGNLAHRPRRRAVSDRKYPPPCARGLATTAPAGCRRGWCPW